MAGEKETMDDLMKENLEDYLSGVLIGRRKDEFESYLNAHPKAAEAVEQQREAAALLSELRVPEEDGMPVQPSPGFYARVMNQVDDERSVPFWEALIEPVFVKRLAFACLMWFFLLGAYATVFDGLGEDTAHVAERMLTQPPSPEYHVRFGGDLERNRDSMLSAMMASRGAR